MVRGRKAESYFSNANELAVAPNATTPIAEPLGVPPTTLRGSYNDLPAKRR